MFNITKTHGHRAKLTTVIALVAACGMMLAGCGSSVGAVDVPVVPSDGDVTIRLSWWGGDSRVETTEKAVKAFEKEHPNIHVDMEYSDWTGYWDKLGVQSAGGNAPDVMQMDQLYLAFYGSMESLLDLGKASECLKTDDMDSELLDLGKVDGKLVAMPMTTAQYGVIVNSDVLDELDITLPDTSNWTWDEFEQVAQQVYKKSDGKYIGAIAPNNSYGLDLWARQHGESTFKGNNVTISPETLASFLRQAADWAKNGISGTAERWSENTTATLNDTDFGKGKQAFMLTQSTQITPYAQAAGTGNMTLVPLPQVKPETKTMYLKPGMYLAVSSQSQHPAEAAMLVDYLVNDAEAGQILGTERGIPANESIRKSLSETATGTDKLALDFVSVIRPTIGTSPDIVPNGASDLDTMIVRYQQNVVFGRQKPLDAANAMIDELQEAIDFAS